MANTELETLGQHRVWSTELVFASDSRRMIGVVAKSTGQRVSRKASDGFMTVTQDPPRTETKPLAAEIRGATVSTKLCWWSFYETTCR